MPTTSFKLQTKDQHPKTIFGLVSQSLNEKFKHLPFFTLNQVQDLFLISSYTFFRQKNKIIKKSKHFSISKSPTLHKAKFLLQIFLFSRSRHAYGQSFFSMVESVKP